MCILMRYGVKFSTNEATKRGRVLGAPYIQQPPTPLPGDILETLIHISDSDQDTPGGIGLELSNVVD